MNTKITQFNSDNVLARNRWGIVNGLVPQFIACLLLCFFLLPVSAQALERVEAVQDVKGWKLQVDGQDYYVKGVVWGYTPKGENYNYNLWAHSNTFIKHVLDEEFTLMKAAGINTIRTFGTIPPKWVTYIYKEYGVRTVINHLFGRYGFNVNGKWRGTTDYSDPATRKAIKADVIQIVRKYSNTQGILMFALGNENNYGLEWSSSEIENLPKGEQQKGKAQYLYSLFNEAIKEAKLIDSRNLYMIVNGDVQYLDLIKELCPDLDVLGSNAYRGPSFGSLWADVKSKYDRPVVFTEFGSDAFNALENREDQLSQAKLLKSQWKEMYQKSYGHGEEGNSIGGFVFQWRDGWWKYKQTENLDVHDRTASWANGGYKFDFAEGKNNMNEEWFGITRMGKMDSNGVYTSEPRMAYDVLTEIWKLDPYRQSRASLTAAINNIDMDYLSLRSDVRMLKSKDETRDILSFTGGSLKTEFVATGEQSGIKRNGLDSNQISDGEMLFLDFSFQPTQEITGQFSVNVLGNVPNRNITVAAYGDRGKPVVIPNTLSITGNTTVRQDRIEIYDYEGKYEDSNFKLSSFYHVPRFHWGYEGDFFGLLRETTDLEGMDIWNAKAPIGIEFEGKGMLQGLKVLAGPEVYWGANPKVMLKYNDAASGITLMHSEELGRRGSSASDTQATEKRLSQTTVSLKMGRGSNTFQVGAMISSREKIGDVYRYMDAGNVMEDKIRFLDTLGGKARLDLDVASLFNLYVAGGYFGLVSDGGDPLVEMGTKLPYSSLGNKYEVEAGTLFRFGDVTLYPRALYRNNLRSANQTIAPTTVGAILNPGINIRNREDDPFAVLGNRAARSAEVILTWDPTPATDFYQWDNDKHEDARTAANLGFVYTKYPTVTDSELFFYQQGQTNAAFGQGLPAENVWLAHSRIVMNPSRSLKLIANLEAGFQQSTGLPGAHARRYYDVKAKAIFNDKYIHSAYFKKDAWGPYDFQRQFNIVYPVQVMYDFSVLLDPLHDQLKSNKWGIRGLYRTLDANAPASEYQNGANKYMYEITMYYTASF